MEGLEHIIHERLERSWRVGETERHYEKFEVVVVGSEGCLLNVGGVHVHLMVPQAQVYLGEELGAMELIEELVDHWDQELVLGHLIVERPVVDAEMPVHVCLLD